MNKLGKFGTAAVLGLVLSLAIFATGAFALAETDQASQISVSAHAATMQSILQGTASQIRDSAMQKSNIANNNCGNWGWGNGCGNCGSHCGHAVEDIRCASERECHTIQVCHSSHWGRVCHGEHICRFRSIRHRFLLHHHDGGWNTAWGVKQH